MNNFWDRNIKVVIKSNSQEITLSKSKENHLNYNVEVIRDISEGSNTAKIEVYNYSNDLIKKINLGSKVEIYGGYGEELTLIYKGIVEKAPSGKKHNNDILYTIHCNTYNDDYKDTIIDLKIKKNGSASSALKQIISNFENLKVGKIELGKEIEYKDGKTVHNNLKNVLKSIAKDTESIFYVDDGVVNFRNPKEMNNGTFELDESYLLDIISNDNGYKIKSVFSSKIKEGMDFKAKVSKNEIEFSGTFPVVSVVHKLSFDKEFFTEFQIESAVEKKENEKKIKLVVG